MEYPLEGASSAGLWDLSPRALREDTFPDLLTWLEAVGDPEVKRAVARRRGRRLNTPVSGAYVQGTSTPKTPVQPVRVGSERSPEPPDKHPEDPVLEPPLDVTVLGTRSTKVLGELSWAEEEPVPITRRTVLVGRRLDSSVSDDQVQPVQVEDPGRTVSATHARLEHKDGKWWIQDLESTNGIFLLDSGGNEIEVVGKAPLSRDFYLGDVLFTFHVNQPAEDEFDLD